MRRNPSHKVYERRYAATARSLALRAAAPARLFAGMFPEGIVYADKGREEHGDYAKLAFLPYRTRVVEYAKNCPPEFRELIEADAKQYKLGEVVQISSSGQGRVWGV